MDSEEEPVTYVQDEIHQALASVSTGPIVLVNPEIKSYFRSYNLEQTEAWLKKPEIPASGEILPLEQDDDDCIDLMPNRIDGPWPSKDTYLRAHYELIREDAVAPLRDAVAYFRNDPQMRDSKAVSVYEKVYITGITFARRGIAFRIQFSTNRSGRRIVWEYSKRLITGSVVALSPKDDAFRTKCFVAVVAARPLEGVKQEPPEIDIFFARPEDANFDPHQEWVMVEARTGYYEASRHTMAALQKLNYERFPLADHICTLGSNIDPPDYVKQRPIMDIQSAIDDSDKEAKVNLLDSWPKSPIGDLDKSQWEALRQILTKKLAIIQGPPGTGKTFVSVIALRILLSNMEPQDPPIIVSSQTNHALDQLLRHISAFEKGYVRLGGRSSDLEIKKHTLFAMRQKEPPPTVQGGIYGPSMRKFKSLVAAIVELLQPFNQEDDGTPLPSNLFVKYGLLTPVQHDSLEKGAKGWIRPDTGENADPLNAWLGDQVFKFQVAYTKENFGFDEDEIDLEYEQLKEVEVEQGVEEDDFENLRGQFIFLREAMCGLVRSIQPEKSSLDYLKYPDMWKIPVKARGAVYDILRGQLKTKILEQFQGLAARYAGTCADLQIGKWERDYLILRNTKVIGMTTTGLSKYRALISSVRPKIILIEEAAEAIEAPIAVGCLDSVQHLILVGDHQQLKGHCAVQDLEGEPFHLDVSMFERLVKNGIDYVTLRRQRRMAPEIRRLLEPIYGNLEDHPTVLERPHVPGMGEVRSFFFSHDWPESSDSMASKFNEMEAEMIVGFFVYLVLNGVSIDTITVLTFYNGQRKKLLRMIKNHSYLQGHYVKVVTVDSYQGEENDVVILSLVRGSNAKSIGFLSVANRVCVALSRARNGLYIFGNAKCVSAADDLWSQVIEILAGEHPYRSIGVSLPLTCQKHSDKTFIQEPSDWSRLNGGCLRPCGEALECGHKCSLSCHSFSHEQVQCQERCNLRMLCGHVCDRPCVENHSCTCKCEMSSAILSELELANAELSSMAHRERTRAEEELKRQAIRGYQEFAKWGAKQQDIQLLRKANPRSIATVQRESQSAAVAAGPRSARDKKGKKRVPAVRGEEADNTNKEPDHLELEENVTLSKPRAVQVGNLLDLLDD